MCAGTWRAQGPLSLIRTLQVNPWSCRAWEFAASISFVRVFSIESDVPSGRCEAPQEPIHAVNTPLGKSRQLVHVCPWRCQVLSIGHEEEVHHIAWGQARQHKLHMGYRSYPQTRVAQYTSRVRILKLLNALPLYSVRRWAR